MSIEKLNVAEYHDELDRLKDAGYTLNDRRWCSSPKLIYWSESDVVVIKLTGTCGAEPYARLYTGSNVNPELKGVELQSIGREGEEFVGNVRFWSDDLKEETLEVHLSNLNNEKGRDGYSFRYETERVVYGKNFPVVLDGETYAQNFLEGNGEIVVGVYKTFGRQAFGWGKT